MGGEFQNVKCRMLFYINTSPFKLFMKIHTVNKYFFYGINFILQLNWPFFVG